MSRLLANTNPASSGETPLAVWSQMGQRYVVTDWSVVPRSI